MLPYAFASDASGSALRDGTFHDVVAQVETFFDWTNTRVVAYYRINSRQADHSPGHRHGARHALRRPVEPGAPLHRQPDPGRLGPALRVPERVLRHGGGRHPRRNRRGEPSNARHWGYLGSLLKLGVGEVGGRSQGEGARPPFFLAFRESNALDFPTSGANPSSRMGNGTASFHGSYGHSAQWITGTMFARNAGRLTKASWACVLTGLSFGVGHDPA